MTLDLNPAILWPFLGILTLIVIKTIFAALIANRTGEFKWAELPRFIYTNVVPYGGGLLGLAIPLLGTHLLPFFTV